jgi:RNA-splicing ligase RtcB
VTDPAIKQGINQLGILGSGNHCVEVQDVSNDRIFDHVTAAALGITGHEQIVAGDALRFAWVRPSGGKRLSQGV